MKLKSKNLSIGIWSEDYEKLAFWYENTLEFKVRKKLNFPNDTVVDFDFGNNFFFIGKHDKIHGVNADQYRVMIGFQVESVSEIYQNLKSKNVRFIAEPFEGAEGGYWCTTIQDPEKNILQFFGGK